jgi:hypothetical protein
MKVVDLFIQKHIKNKANVSLHLQSSVCINRSTWRKVTLISYLDPEKQREMEAGIHFLKKHFQEVTFLLYTPKMELTNEQLPIFMKKDFTWKGDLREKNDKRWNHPAKCDLLLVYNPIHAHQIESLAVQFESPLRLGTHPGYDELYNILYEMPPNGDFKRFLQDVVQLIKSFRNHDEPALV